MIFCIVITKMCSKQHVISTLFISYIFTHCSTHLSFYLSILRLSTSPQTGHCNICLSIVVSIGGSKGLERHESHCQQQTVIMQTAQSLDHLDN